MITESLANFDVFPSKEEMEGLLRKLIYLRETIDDATPYCRRLGICEHIYLRSGKTRTLFDNICQGWQYYSGEKDYPVPHSDMSPELAFHRSSDLWDRKTEYGTLRHDLLGFSIEFLEKALKEEKDIEVKVWSKN